MNTRVVIDTSVFVSALIGRDSGACREVIRRAFSAVYIPLMGEALFHEYEDLFFRDSLFEYSPLNFKERVELKEAYYSVCIWVPIYYKWRPNLRDEADNHVIELAVAGGASTIVTKNRRDFKSAELQFPDIKISGPIEFIQGD